MYYGFCNNSDDHKREGREDFERRGRYGYDMEKYHDLSNDCNRAYSDGFDDARRDADRREEQRQEEYRLEQRQMREARDRRDMLQAEEDAYWDAMYDQQEHQQEQPPPQQPEPDDLPF